MRSREEPPLPHHLFDLCFRSTKTIGSAIEDGLNSYKLSDFSQFKSVKGNRTVISHEPSSSNVVVEATCP